MPKKSQTTFPQPTNAFFLSNGLVSINGATVASCMPKRPGLCLKTDFHHICRLSKRNRHGTSGTSRKQPTADANI